MKHSEKVIQTIENYCMRKPAAYESRPFGTYPICYRIMGKIFAQLNPESHFYKMTLKCRPEQAQIYRQLYPSVVVRGYHCPPIQQPYLNGKPVGCGGFKMYDEEHAELKRIFTVPSCRGIGLGAEIIRRLEAKAKIKGFRWCILETGKPLEAACHLYAKAGYQVIDNYGQYLDMPASICMQHKI